MLTVGFILAIAIEILMPFALGIWFIRKFGVSWKLFGVGVLTFIASQVIHLPILSGINVLLSNLQASVPITVLYIINAVLLGLAAGLCEETARYVGFRLLKGRAKKIGSALMVGAGHGGVESILIGLVVLTNFVMYSIVSSGSAAQFGLPADVVAQVAPQVGAFMNMPWYTPLAGAIERVFAMTLHLTLSIMVWQAFVKRSWKWFVGAILWHAFVDASAVIMSTYSFNMFLLEGVVGVMSIANVIFLVWFIRRELEIEAEEAEEGGMAEEPVIIDGQVEEPVPELAENEVSTTSEEPAGQEEEVKKPGWPFDDEDEKKKE